jgi:hypothetical protein
MNKGISRRWILQAGVRIVPFVMVSRVLPPGTQASAQQKASKQQVQYQESPKKGPPAGRR